MLHHGDCCLRGRVDWQECLSHLVESKRGSARRGTTCRALFLRSWQFSAFAPEIDGEGDGHHREYAPEFVDEPLRLPSVTRDWSEYSLDIKIVAGVEDCPGPQAARL